MRGHVPEGKKGTWLGRLIRDIRLLPVSARCGHNIGKLGLDGRLNGKPNSLASNSIPR
jgi:hypothetical protein